MSNSILADNDDYSYHLESMNRSPTSELVAEVREVGLLFIGLIDSQILKNSLTQQSDF